MNILHINYMNSGGAFIAAERLVSQQNNNEFTCQLVTEKDYLLFLKRQYTLSYISYRIQMFLYFRILKKIIGIDRDFDFGWMPRVNEFLRFYNADLVHIHWVCGAFLNAKAISKVRTYRPVVITMHDCFGLYGLDHYSPRLSEPNMAADLIALLQQRHRKKYIKNLALVIPSRWLYNQVVPSYLGAQNQVFHIPNILFSGTLMQPPNLETSHQSKIKVIREMINKDTLCISMGAMTGARDLRKGTKQAIKILESISRPYVLITFGGCVNIEAPTCVNHINLGLLSQSEVLDVLSLSDLVVVPSLEDNYPNILLESLAMGCRTLCFQYGGGGAEMCDIAHPDAFYVAPYVDDFGHEAAEVLNSLTVLDSIEREIFSRHLLDHLKSRQFFEIYKKIYNN
jgi:glycosyltransferase involved in cell wall biosynthesis